MQFVECVGLVALSAFDSTTSASSLAPETTGQKGLMAIRRCNMPRLVVVRLESERTFRLTHASKLASARAGASSRTPNLTGNSPPASGRCRNRRTGHTRKYAGLERQLNQNKEDLSLELWFEPRFWQDL
jgi:hypothetical protein